MARNYQLEQTVLEMKQVLLNSQLSMEISSLSQALNQSKKLSPTTKLRYSLTFNSVV